jgi:hypothetical protein
MRRSHALRRNGIWRVLGVALTISLVGSAIVMANHAHALGSDNSQNCAVCQVVHQPVQLGNPVAQPEPTLPRAMALVATTPSETPTRQPFHPHLSRAPPV